jgi:uncharacterized protein (DUF1015 family)
MVMLRPFRPLRYHPAAVGDLAAVVAPPYDVVSEAYRDTLYARSEHNVIRLILNRDADRYTAAATLLRQWRATGVLVQDTQTALCYYVEDFTLPDGTARQRAGVMAAVRLESFDGGRIRPHERTFSRAKEDRLRLLQACRTNLSPIFGLYADKPDALEPARCVAARRTPDIDLRDDSGERHRLWLLTDPTEISAIGDALAAEAVVIADGHHRYETALAYRDQMRVAGAADPDDAHNFVLMYLTSMSDPGLVILPTHRVLVDGIAGDPASLPERLRRHFRLTAFAGSARHEFKAALRQTPGRFGVAVAGCDELFIAGVDDVGSLDPYLSQLASEVRRLDVTVLDRVILRGVLDVDCTQAAQAGRLTYTHDDDSALDAVRHGAQAAFLINPPRIEDVVAVCAAGETMPEKSTYFFPKLLTGLVFHALDYTP